jgi:hypothetical protein
MRFSASRIAPWVAAVDDLRPGDVLAVLGVVADRIVHVADAALVDQVDDLSLTSCSHSKYAISGA